MANPGSPIKRTIKTEREKHVQSRAYFITDRRIYCLLCITDAFEFCDVLHLVRVPRDTNLSSSPVLHYLHPSPQRIIPISSCSHKIKFLTASANVSPHLMNVEANMLFYVVMGMEFRRCWCILFDSGGTGIAALNLHFCIILIPRESSSIWIHPSRLHTESAEFLHSQCVNKQVVGGRPPWYATAQACSGSAQQQPYARPTEPGPISQYAPSSWPAAHATRRPDVRDRHQTDRRQTASSLNASWAGTW